MAGFPFLHSVSSGSLLDVVAVYGEVKRKSAGGNMGDYYPLKILLTVRRAESNSPFSFKPSLFE